MADWWEISPSSGTVLGKGGHLYQPHERMSYIYDELPYRARPPLSDLDSQLSAGSTTTILTSYLNSRSPYSFIVRGYGRFVSRPWPLDRELTAQGAPQVKMCCVCRRIAVFFDNERRGFLPASSRRLYLLPSKPYSVSLHRYQ